MKFYSWNVNSLRSCETNFLDFMSTYKPDVVGIQELRATPDQLSFFLKTITGYSYVFNDSGRPGYGGTALYYRNDLNLKTVTNKTGNPVLDSEGRVISLQLDDILFFNFYTPNGNASEERLKYKLSYFAEILKLARDLMKKRAKVIVGGDLNVAHTELDLYLKDCNHSGFLPEERKWFDNMLHSGFLDSLRMFTSEGSLFTWWHLRDPKRELNNGWRFDYFLVSNNLKGRVTGAGILKDVFGSDHCPIWVELD